MSEPIWEYPQFYFVWTKRGHVPRYAHSKFSVACAEAKRLAAKHPGEKFIVLGSISKVHVAVAEPLVEPLWMAV